MSEKQKPAAAEVPSSSYSDFLALLPEELLQPGMTQKLLTAQLAEALSIMRGASYLYHRCVVPHECGQFADHTEKLLMASVGAAERIALLKNGSAQPEKRFHYTVEHIEGGKGSEKSENE